MPGRGAATHGPRVTPPATKTKRKRHHSFTPEIPWFIYCTQAQGEMRFLQPTGELVIVNQQRIFFPGCKKSSISESHNRRRTVSLEAWALRIDGSSRPASVGTEPKPTFRELKQKSDCAHMHKRRQMLPAGNS